MIPYLNYKVLYWNGNLILELESLIHISTYLISFHRNHATRYERSKTSKSKK